MRSRLIVFLAVLSFAAILSMPPIRQDPAYHGFADRRTIIGVTNFWNVVSNLPFLVVALWGWRGAATAERRIFLIGVAGVTFGSGWYHAHPDNATLFWDRLPMTVAFMALFAEVIGKRVSSRTGRRLLIPLLVFGVASVIYWRYTDDLRFYVLVQFFPLLALLLLLDGRRDPLLSLIGLYAFAKLLEWQDHAIAAVVSTGGHPWKHLAASAAVFAYVACDSHPCKGKER